MEENVDIMERTYPHGGGPAAEGPAMARTQVTITLEDDVLDELKQLRDETGLPLSKIISLRLRGYRVVKADEAEA